MRCYRLAIFNTELNFLIQKVMYYAIRVGFQFRGSSYIHSFLWMLNAPTLKENSISAYVNF